MAYVETLIKQKVGSEWLECTDVEALEKGDIVRIYERFKTSGRYFLKEVGGMSAFLLLADGCESEIMIGAWLPYETLTFLEKEGGRVNV